MSLRDDWRFCPRCGSALSSTVVEDFTRTKCAACPFVLYDNPTPVVAGILEQDDAVILVRNRGWPEKFFGLVTGFLERAEKPDEAIVREVSEELGLQGKVVSLIGNFAFAPMNQVLLVYHVVVAGEITLSSELEAWKKVPIAKLRPWPQGTGEAVRLWLEQRSNAST